MAPYPLSEGLAILADVAHYLGSDDPIEIGAGFLLELEGFEQTREQLSLFSAADQIRRGARIRRAERRRVMSGTCAAQPLNRNREERLR